MQEINGGSSICLICRASDPSQLFGEIKDGGYPRAEWRHHFFAIGGSTSDFDAQADAGPRDTFERELMEELALPASATAADVALLERLKSLIRKQAVPFHDYFFEIPESCFRRFGANRPTWREVASVFVTDIEETDWETLRRLQDRYGNLSSESRTTLISAPEVLEGTVKISWETAIIVRDFWAERGIAGADRTPLIEEVVGTRIGMPRSRYADYRNDYTVKHRLLPDT